MSDEISFGAWLRLRRRLLDLTQQALADQVGCARITMRRIEAGALKPSKELAQILLEKLGIPEFERPQWILFARGLASFPISPVDSIGQPLSNLPASLTTFIGREKEQAEIIKHVKKYRLVTLTGPGGVGKTRLSIKIGEQVSADYVNGVWLVELASLSDPTLLPQTVITLFGITAQPKISPTEILINFLRAKTLLLILDNCEHLLDACAQLADTLLKNCPGLKILATSREALGITGEAAYDVPSLGLPDLHLVVDKFREYESVRLFEERAGLAQLDFTLTMENASSVAQICHRLDGIPLAIELAAAHVNMFSTEQIATKLTESFNLLTGGSRTALPRQQTIRASIEWSWNLLSDSEQILLRRLSVFAGGWILESAESVCSENGTDKGQVLELMSQLVAKSLVVMNQESGRERRYHLLETIRQYANEKLSKSGEKETIRTQHLKYFLQLAEVAEAMWIGPKQVEWYIRMDDERDDIRVALEWAHQNPHVNEGLLIFSELKNLWLNWDLSEGISWGKSFLQAPQSYDHPRARAKALYIYGQLLTRVEQIDAAYAAGEECLALARACGDPYVEVNGLLLMGWVMVFLRNPSRQMEYGQQALVLARSIGDEWGEARALSSLGWAERDHDRVRLYWNEAEKLTRLMGNWYGLSEHLGDFGNFELLDGNLEIAQKKLDEVVVLNKLLNNRKKMGVALQALGRIALLRGDFKQARAKFNTNLITAEERGSRLNYLWSQCFLGCVALQEGHFIEARDVFIECVQEFQKDKTSLGTIGTAFTLERIVTLFTGTNKPKQAAMLIGWATIVREEMREPRPLIEQNDVDRDIATIISKIGLPAFEAAYHKGRAMTLDEAVALALEGN